MYNAHVKVLDTVEIVKEMEKIGVAKEGIDIMAPKAQAIMIRMEQVPIKAALILKQEALSCGADCALGWNVVALKTEFSDLLLFGLKKQLTILAEKMKRQPFNGAKISKEILEILANFDNEEYILKFAHSSLSMPPVKVMGILNITPDSFSDGNRYMELDKAVDRAKQLELEGADMIDIGGESTRPFSRPVSLEEELKRVVPVIEKVASEVKVPISIDTYKWQVAEKCASLGADLINDVTGLADPKMMEIVKKYNTGIVVMHMQNNPETMQILPQYRNVISEIYAFLKNRTDKALEYGIEKDRIVVDPGIGFGKGLEHNLTILKHLKEFKGLGYPIMTGTSRKGFIGKILDLDLNERLMGSVVSAVISTLNGASIVRVHDVAETKNALKLAERIVK